MVYSKIFRAARANLLSILKEKGGGDLHENGDFQTVKCLGGDVTKNSDFIEGKIVVLYQSSIGAM